MTFENIVFAALAVTFVGGIALCTWLAITWPSPEARTHIVDAGRE